MLLTRPIQKDVEVMSFNYFARKVMNPNLPMGVRYSALHSCILRLVWKTGEPFTKAVARLNSEFGFKTKDPSDYQLLSTLAAVERERNLVLEKVRAFEHRRIREKIRGKRCISKKDQNTVPKAFGSP